jgi:hypothetical protein
MKDLKGSGLTDRLSTAAAAKAALVAKMKPKPAVTDPLFEERAAMRATELKDRRIAHTEARDAAREAAAAAKAADVAAIAAAKSAADDAALAEKRGARKERKQLTKAEAQAKRDARYAARKAR